MTSLYVGVLKKAPRAADVVLEPGVNLFTGAQDFETSVGQSTTLERDLLLVGAAVFAADRAVLRGEREEFARRLEVSIPVVNVGRLAPVREELERVLRFLSRDDWRLDLRQESGRAELGTRAEGGEGTTLLLSGGLDSLGAAIELGREGRPTQLVSHITHNTVSRNAQRQIVGLLQDAGYAVTHCPVFVSSQKNDRNPAHDQESSQRTRSFLFLILAALVARRSGHGRVVWLAENGHMAIHLPLVSARLGAFSTHTANPEFVRLMQGVLSNVLGRPITIENPFLYRTKGEVVATIRGVLPAAIGASVSCWRTPRAKAQKTHCGVCIPCFVRRVALEVGGNDPTEYERDPWQIPLQDQESDDTGRRNLVDLGIFVQRVEAASDDEMLHQWPELLVPAINQADAIALYRRFVAEVRQVLTRYPAVEAVLL
jgi:7-cyano-7-deazaguanine synthase in queuosine biosynthesis